MSVMAEWLTTKQASEYLQVHPKTIYRYVRMGKLVQHQPGGKGRPRFRIEDLDKLLEEAGAERASSDEGPAIAPEATGGLVLGAPVVPSSALLALGQDIQQLVAMSHLTRQEEALFTEYLLVCARNGLTLVKSIREALKQDKHK